MSGRPRNANHCGVVPPWFERERELIYQWNDKLKAEGLSPIGEDDEVSRVDNATRRMADAEGEMTARWLHREIWASRRDRIVWALQVAGWSIPRIQRSIMASHRARATEHLRVAQVRERMVRAHRMVRADRRRAWRQTVSVESCYQHERFTLECAMCREIYPEHMEALADVI